MSWAGALVRHADDRARSSFRNVAIALVRSGEEPPAKAITRAALRGHEPASCPHMAAPVVAGGCCCTPRGADFFTLTYHWNMADLTLNAFDSWLWSAEDQALLGLDLADLAARSALDGVRLRQLTVLTLIAEGPSPGEVLRGAIGVEAVRQVAGLDLIRANMGSRSYVVAAWPTHQAGVFHLTGSVPVTDDAWERVEGAWMNAARSRLAEVILNRGDFDDIGHALAEHGSVETARMTARVLRDSSSYTRGWPQIQGARRPSHRDALSETDGMLVKTITLDVGAQTRVQLRRSSGASFIRGDFRLFHDVVLTRLASAAVERRQLLAGRAREPLAPLRETVSMSVDLVDLDDARVRRELLTSLGAVRGVQVAVMHENPYLHALVTDFENASTFDLLVTDGGRLDIVPGLRSSVGSLARVTDALGATLGMRDISLRPVDRIVPDEEFLGA
jgi:hypothetical protein